MTPSFAQELEDVSFRQWVDYRNGELSVAFDDTPLPVALSVIYTGTGLQIDMPTVDQEQVVNLRLSGLPFESAMRLVLASMGYDNFAVMYDDEGRPSRAIVINARLNERADLLPDEAVEPQHDGPVPLPLTTEEQERIQREFDRWHELKDAQRGRIIDRLKSLPPSAQREQLVQEYGKTLLGLNK